MSIAAWVALALGSAFVITMIALALATRRAAFSSGRGARLVRLGRLSARLSASWFGATVRRRFAGKERRARIDAARRKADAERIAETMGHMKGALMKLGQMLSFISEEIPEEYRAALASLQAQAPPMDFALLRDVAEHELGRPLERAFARFDAEPIASASIGQVHRALLPDGTEVVVKIQYPGVAEAIAGDLKNADLLYRMAGLMYPALDPKPVVEELRGRILEELDYRREARNQRAFAELFDGHPFIRVPKVIEDWSTARVLTSEYVDGRRFTDALSDDAAARSRWGEILYRFVFSSILKFGVFNGDPHPGNYLFDADNKMVFLDFGCVKFFPDPMMRTWRALVLAHADGDHAAFRRRLVELGFLRDDAPVDADTLFDYFGYFYEPWLEDRDFTYNSEYNKKSLRMVFAPEGRFAGLEKRLNMPPDFVFVNRIQWGVYSILGQLEATANWHRIHNELLHDTAPSTPLGEADAAHWRSWLARHPELEGHRWMLTQEGVRRRE